MTRTVTAGLDGTPESLAAADWAAREALLRDLPLRLVNAGEWQLPACAPASGLSVPTATCDQQRAGARSLLEEARARVGRSHPGLRIEADALSGPPAPALLTAAEDADLLVLGSRGLGRLAGFVVGSVALSVLADCEGPVVLVRAEEHTDGDRLPDASTGGSSAAVVQGEVILGLDLQKPSDQVIEFAFDAARRRAANLRVVHGWTVPPYYYGGDLMPEVNVEMAAQAQRRLDDMLQPWQRKFPTVEMRTQATVGGAGPHLIEASRDAALVVVGRHVRRAAVGTHIGPVTQALLHHAAAPVAVVPHH
ncbi:universal stress protein [Streptomyces sp. NPDC047197]|uniref:universal stress protein n=1 Tax=Streptomyces sp. NPDC047197 TaxID=3155477 RepID=UPI0033CEE61D